MSRILFSLFVSGIKWAIELKISCLYSAFPQRTFSKKQAKKRDTDEASVCSTSLRCSHFKSPRTSSNATQTLSGARYK